MLERLNEEIRRRTYVVRIFPNTDSCLLLARALAVETHENWLEAHRYLNMNDRCCLRLSSQLRTESGRKSPRRPLPNQLMPDRARHCGRTSRMRTFSITCCEGETFIASMTGASGERPFATSTARAAAKASVASPLRTTSPFALVTLMSLPPVAGDDLVLQASWCRAPPRGR